MTSVAGVLERLNQAFAAGDTEAVVALFEPEGFWRDLVTFTWNIKTLEGRDEIREMLKAQLAEVAPSHFAEDPTQEEGWFSFETRVGRGYVISASGMGSSGLS